ncbi:MAG: hypothetical protein PHW74_00345 [Desulfobacca sp.]|nr:hypothetical protein [Desulfobacca sp.]
MEPHQAAVRTVARHRPSWPRLEEQRARHRVQRFVLARARLEPEME